MARYLLSSDSYVCMAEDSAVFLDLRRDKYLAIDSQKARALENIVLGWPKSLRSSTAPPDPSIDVEDLARALIDEGLLTHRRSQGKPATPVSLAAPTSTFLADPYPWPYLHAHHVRNFVAAWLTVTAMLRCLPLRWVVRRVQRRHAAFPRSSHTFDPAINLDPVKTRALVLNYLVLQPAFFSARDACLRNSLTLMEFLSRYGLHATWVFGVRMNPWAAHSWVQSGSIVLNDTLESVRSYTPILTV
jgi:hypothetical protein